MANSTEETMRMSSHWKFEVHVKTPGESDDEKESVEQFATVVQHVARILNPDQLVVAVTSVERD
jgi:hypothetical protein